MIRGESERVLCPRCQSVKVWKDGLRKNGGFEAQRYFCRECGHRFSDSLHSLGFSVPSEIEVSCQVCDGESKNLIVVPENGTTGEISEKKSLLFQFTWYMKKQAFAESTIQTRVRQIDVLIKRGANINDPESVKEAIASQSWVNKRKQNVVDTYSCFLKMLGKSWVPPKYKQVHKIPFIPTESEIDTLIEESGPKTSAFLLVLKDTAARAGEVQQVKWSDVDFEAGTIRITPEKGSYPRMIKVSNKLINKLAALKKRKNITDSDRIFGKLQRSIRRVFMVKRKKLAYLYDNPRLLQIHFHTFRHWKATSLYHQTKDIVYVQRFLGHRSIMNTMMYIHIEQAYYRDETDQNITKVAKTIEEAIPLIEQGFTEASDFNGAKIFKKPKSTVVQMY
jgi:integrase